MEYCSHFLGVHCHSDSTERVFRLFLGVGYSWGSWKDSLTIVLFWHRNSLLRSVALTIYFWEEKNRLEDRVYHKNAKDVMESWSSVVMVTVFCSKQPGGPIWQRTTINEIFIFKSAKKSFSFILHSFYHVNPQKHYSKICRGLCLAGFLSSEELQYAASLWE
jgi:hypothetical protein